MQQQMDWRTALQFAGVGLAIVVILRLASFIGSFLAGLGILAIGHMFVAVAYLPKWRRTATWIIILWTLVVVVKPVVWNSLPVMVQDALSSREGVESTRLSETFRGHGADAMQELAFYCSKTEEQYTNEISVARQELDRLGLYNPNRVEKEIAFQQKVKNVEEWRRKCTKDLQYDDESISIVSKNIANFFSAIASALHPNTNKEWYDLLGILLLAGFGLYVATWKGKWTQSVGAAMLLAFIFFLGRYVLFETDLPKPVRKAWEDSMKEESPEEKEARKRAEETRRVATRTAIPLTLPPITIADTKDPYAISNALRAGHKKVILTFRPDVTGNVETPDLQLGSGCGDGERFYYDLSPRAGKVNGKEVGFYLPLIGSLKWEYFSHRSSNPTARITACCLPSTIGGEPQCQ